MKTLAVLCLGTLVASVNANYVSNTTTAAPATTAAAIEDASTLTINLASEPAGPLGLFQSIYREVFDVQDEDEDDSAADESFTPYEGTDMLKMLQKTKTCDSFGKKCTKCIKNGGCSYCDTTKKCMDAAEAKASCKKITTSKWKCSDHMRWWGLFLILFCCICLCPLLSFICFVCVIKKLCCPSDSEADD